MLLLRQRSRDLFDQSRILGQLDQVLPQEVQWQRQEETRQRPGRTLRANGVVQGSIGRSCNT